MLKLYLPELILRAIPEDLLFVLAAYIFSNTKVDKKKLFISGIILGIGIYLIRLLPVHFGVHSIISIVFHICILTWYNRIDLLKAVSAVLTTFIMCYFFEWLNVMILIEVLGPEFSEVFYGRPLLKTLYGMPSLVLLAITIIIVYYVKKFLFKEKLNVPD